MFGKTFVAASIIALGASSAAMAQTPKMLGKFENWGAYFYKEAAGTVCYALSVPTGKEPQTLNHGDVFFLVSKRPDGSAGLEPQFMAGYNLREDSRVTVTVGAKEFSLFTKGKSAWVNAGETKIEAALVAAMKAGSTMTVKATSGRGNATSYTYSLKGITAALNAVQKCK